MIPIENKMNLSFDDNFWVFINKIKTYYSNYDYVCVRGRRCFNIISRLLPSIDFITISALMLKYGELSDFYEENNRFPKILLIDDLIFDGCEMAQELEQLENLLTEELLSRNLLNKRDNYRYQVYYNLCWSITIYAYAISSGNIYISGGYDTDGFADERIIRNDIWNIAENRYRLTFFDGLYCEIETHYLELMDISLRFEEKLKSWGIANTNCTYSVNSQTLYDYILKQDNGLIGGTKWVRQEGICMGEKMILYTRLNGETAINRIDTIRIFPNRISNLKELPLVSSQSFFDSLSKNATYLLINDVREELERLGLIKMAEVLKLSSNEKINNILLENQMQFINCILSICVLYDFCCDIIPEELCVKKDMRGDIWKICRNFGKKTELADEMLKIRKDDLRTRLKTIILNIIDSNSRELINVAPNKIFDCDINFEYIELQKITDIIRNVLYCAEMQSRRMVEETMKYEYNNHRFFCVLSYKSSILTNKTYGYNGIIDLKTLLNLNEIQKLSNLSYVYSLIFVVIKIIDNYQAELSMKCPSPQKGDNSLKSYIITRESAMFYFPEKLAMLIDVFRRIEFSTFGSREGRIANFKSFVSACFGIYTDIVLGNFSYEISIDEKKRLTEELLCYSGEETLELALKKIFTDAELFYNAYCTFFEFNFENFRLIANQRSSLIDMTFLRKRLEYIYSAYMMDGDSSLEEHKGFVKKKNKTGEKQTINEKDN